jgi:RNA polymerase sigma factor (TIGR02999 family)
MVALVVPICRHILVQFARDQLAAKRGGRAIQVSLSEAANVSTRHNPDLVKLDDALTALEKLDPRQSRIVGLRFFGGLSLEEAAEVLRVSVSTVRHDWRMAQAWLHQQLSAAT